MAHCRMSCFSTLSHDREFLEKANQRYGFEISYFKERLDIATCRLAHGSQVICAFVNDALGAEVIDLLYRQGVRLIALRCTGYNHVDLRAAQGKIAIVNVPRYSPHSVAEFTIGLLLSLNRKIHLSYSRAQTQNFSIEGFMGFDLYQKRAGVIGAGAIGKQVILLLQAFGMQVSAFDIDPLQVAAAGCSFASLEQIYKESDVLTLHCPLTPGTAHLINSKSLALMKKEALLINTGRGGLVDTKSLLDALKSRVIGGAALDVYEREAEYFYQDFSKKTLADDLLSQLLRLPSVLLTSHHAFFTREALEAIAATTLDSVCAFLEEKPLSCAVL